MRTNNHWLDYAELATVAFSVAGAGAALIKQQLIFAVAPFTVALSLNLINRKRFQQQVQQDHKTTISELKSVTTNLNYLPASLREIDLNEIKAVTTTLGQQLTALTQQFNTRPELEAIEKIQILNQVPLIIKNISIREEKLQKLDTFVESLLIFQHEITQELQRLINRIEQIDNQVGNYANNREEWLGILELLQQNVNVLSHNQEGLVENFKKVLPMYVSSEAFETKFLQFQKDISCEIENLFKDEINHFNQEIKNCLSDYRYKLIYDRDESRQALLRALDNTKKRIILASPWLCKAAINDEVLEKFEKILNNQGIIDIGWGHLTDMNLNEPQMISRKKLISIVQKNGADWKYNALDELEKLEEKYPKQFRLKLLGTHEKFWIRDEKSAMLGSHNFFTSGSSRAEREIGLWTSDPRIITGLIQRFDNARNLEIKKRIFQTNARK